MAEVYQWAHTSPEDREEARKEREFQEWAKVSVKPNWIPKTAELTQEKILK